MTDRYDIVIVGAGHNGLTAAFYLARAGLRTLVLERRELVGRRVRDRGDRAGRPRLDDLLHREHAAARDRRRPRPRRTRAADGPVRAGVAGRVRGSPRAAVVVDARTHRRGDPPDLGARRGRVRPRDRAPPRARPLAAALLPRGGAEPVRDGLEQAPRGTAPVPAVPAPVGRPALGPGAVRDRVARRVRRTAFRVRRGPPPLPGEQRLRDARAARTDREPRSGSCSTCSPAASTTSRASTAT